MTRVPDLIVHRLLHAAEAGYVPDRLLRYGIRALVAMRRRSEARIGCTSTSFAAAMGRQPIAVHTDDANRQHYEVPPEFFEYVLGPWLKYSCAWFDDKIEDLADAEQAMLALTCERAKVEDGMRILDLGCGWGSFTLYTAQQFPNTKILAVSNSRMQGAQIRDRCARRGLDGVEVITADAATLDLKGQRFDRIVSIEMFEHMRNWVALYRRIAGWLEVDGRFFQHVFCHRVHPYLFENDANTDWMARNFFSGGIMPSFDLPSHVGGGLVVEQQWKVSGLHYAKTSEAWLARLDQHQDALLRILGAQQSERPRVAVQRWRMFFMACAELFAYNAGREWFVGHYRLRPTGEG